MPVLPDGGRVLSYGGALRRLTELGGEPVVGVVTRLDGCSGGGVRP